jgi:hypothetical protein
MLQVRSSALDEASGEIIVDEMPSAVEIEFRPEHRGLREHFPIATHLSASSQIIDVQIGEYVNCCLAWKKG